MLIASTHSTLFNKWREVSIVMKLIIMDNTDIIALFKLWTLLECLNYGLYLLF